MPRKKGPEWDYVTLVEPEDTDGVKQGKNKCKLCEHNMETEVSQGLTIFTNELYHALQTATFSVYDFKAIFSVL
eukprot:1153256-Pelagomonas_calceolata.AAC.3